MYSVIFLSDKYMSKHSMDCFYGTYERITWFCILDSFYYFCEVRVSFKWNNRYLVYFDSLKSVMLFH